MIEYRELYQDDLENAPVSRYEYVFRGLDKDLLTAKEELEKFEGSKIMISVLGFKRDRTGGGRVHIKNFDTYEDMDFVTIPRWVVTLSEDQEKRLKALSNTAENNKVEIANVFEAIKAKLKEFYPDISCVKALKQRVEELLSQDLAGSLTADMKKAAKDFKDQIDGLEELTQVFKTDIGKWDISTPFSISENLKRVLSSIQNMEFKLSSFLEQLQTVNEVRTWSASFSDDSTTCMKQVAKHFSELKTSAVALLDQQKKYIADKSIGDQVLSFTLANLPAFGYLNLKGTGSRNNGDEILIEVVMRQPKSSDENSENSSELGNPITLEQTNLVMQLIGARSEVRVGMIFADPFSDDESIIDPNRKHFFTPSAALLLKFGSRKSNFYNEFLDFGIGVNFASPDFDTDGVPEFGTGIIGTAFRDIVSVGVNYNVTHDTFYWFFGVNLPFNIPGLPINTVQSTTDTGN